MATNIILSIMVNEEFTPEFLNLECVFDPIEKIWSGPKTPLKYGPECSLGKILVDKLLEQDDHICLINCDTGKKYTSKEVGDMAINIARHFKKLGFKQGDIIGFCGSNTDYSSSFSVAVFLNGLVLNAIAPNSNPEEIEHIFSITKPSIIFCDGIAYENIQTALQKIGLNTPIYTMIDHISGVPEITEFLKGKGLKEDFIPDPLNEGYLQTAALVCSSATTGVPKVIKVSHATLINYNYVQSSSKNIILNYSSLHWISGIYACILTILGKTSRLITIKNFNIDEFCNIVEDYKPTVIAIPPGYLVQISASPKLKTTDFSSIQYFSCAGSPINGPVVAKIKPYFPNMQIINRYGLTECPLGIIAIGFATNSSTIGKLVHNTEVKVIDNGGNSLGPNETGEILFRQLLPFSGYYNNPKATAEIYSDGWLLTGDIGFMDDECNLNIVDRKVDVIEFKGTKFYPTDIENVILQMPEVAEACVGAVTSYNSSLIPAIAVIVLKKGFSLSPGDVYKFVSNKLDYFDKLEGGIHFLDQIPKNASGKNLRRKLQYFTENGVNVVNF